MKWTENTHKHLKPRSNKCTTFRPTFKFKITSILTQSILSLSFHFSLFIYLFFSFFSLFFVSCTLDIISCKTLDARTQTHISEFNNHVILSTKQWIVRNKYAPLCKHCVHFFLFFFKKHFRPSLWISCLNILTIILTLHWVHHIYICPLISLIWYNGRMHVCVGGIIYARIYSMIGFRIYFDFIFYFLPHTHTRTHYACIINKYSNASFDSLECV